MAQPDQGSAAATTANEVSTIHAGGVMAESVRRFDWSATPLGAIDTWSPTLVAFANLVLSSPQPAILMWGPDLAMVYNDHVLPTLGEKHPAALGHSYREVFAEVWPVIGPDTLACLDRGETSVHQSVRVPLLREGSVQEDFYTYFLTPVYENGRIAGIYNPFIDVTQQRRDQLAKESAAVLQQFLLKLSDTQRASSDVRQIMLISAEFLGLHLKVDRVGYSEASSDLSTMTFETGWAQGTLQPLTGSVPLDHWSRTTSAAFSRGRTVVYPDVRTEPDLVSEQDHYLSIGAVAVIAVPFLRCGVWRGSLYVNSAAPRLWTGPEIELVEEVARRTAEAVERAQAEKELRALADRLGMAQQAGQMASWQLDLATDTLVWDGGASWTYGRSPSEMIHAATVFSYILEEDRDRVRSALIPAIAGTGEYRCEFRVLWPDGSIHWILAFGRTVSAFDGKPTGIVGININVTDQKQAEAALMQTEKLAAVGRLASTMAHEINNPLEAVTNLLYLARQSEDLTEAMPFLETADAELRRAAAITSQALRFHKQATRPTLSTFEQLVYDLFKGKHSRLQNAGAVVEQRDRSSVPVLCFEGEIRQVLSNLVTNAIDALGNRGGKLLLRGRNGKDWKTGRLGMTITLADTGSGMSVPTQLKLFNAFFTTKGIGGTGLGLWVSKEIIERHHGRLHMRTSQHAAHHGSVFTIFLPYEAAVRTAGES